MFSVDYPFADNRRGREWFDRLALESELLEKIGHGTADRLLKLRSAQLEA
jgi:predicted TIM-barrel fold metal-dependent hydrolase